MAQAFSEGAASRMKASKHSDKTDINKQKLKIKNKNNRVITE